jgi:micrococcal nuclease
MSRRLAAVLVPLALAGLIAATWWHAARAPLRPSRGVVVRVVDGDTIQVRAEGRTLDVRLLGIDTPETVDPRRPVGCYGPQASAFARRLLTGRRVLLRYDRELRDRYGRTLAYIYLDRRRPLFVNGALVERGMARTMGIPPNTLHAAELERLQAAAALAGRGLWGACG